MYIWAIFCAEIFLYSLLILEDRRFLQRQFFCSSLVRRGIIVFIIAVLYKAEGRGGTVRRFVIVGSDDEVLDGF